MNARTGQSRSPVQEAVKILSLRLPKFYGSGGAGIAPAPLLQAPGAMGNAGFKGDVTAQALAKLAGMPMGVPPTVPTLPGGGTDTFDGWARHERELNGRGTVDPTAPSKGVMSFLPPPPRVIPGDAPPVAPSPITPVGPIPAPDPSYPIDLTPPVPPAPEPSSPWERPGRDPRMAEKYLEELFGNY